MKTIELSGNTTERVVLDEADYPNAAQYRWYLHAKGYAYRKVRGPGLPQRNIFLHRELLGLAPGDPRQGEHIDRNPLNCRRSNLRIAERGDLDNKQNLGLNANNTSGYRGVTWSKQKQRWKGQCTINYKNHHVGLFDTAEECNDAVSAFRAAHMPFSEDAIAA